MERVTKYVFSTEELAYVLSPVARCEMARRYFPNTVEKLTLPDGRTYIEALADALRIGDNALQTKVLLLLVRLYRQNLRKWRVPRAKSTECLAAVLSFAESCGLTPDSQTVHSVRDILQQKQFPKA